MLLFMTLTLYSLPLENKTCHKIFCFTIMILSVRLDVTDPTNVQVSPEADFVEPKFFKL